MHIHISHATSRYSYSDCFGVQYKQDTSSKLHLDLPWNVELFGYFYSTFVLAYRDLSMTIRRDKSNDLVQILLRATKCSAFEYSIQFSSKELQTRLQTFERNMRNGINRKLAIQTSTYCKMDRCNTCSR